MAVKRIEMIARGSTLKTTQTEDDPYCMPRPEELLDKMGNTKYISTLDMLKAMTRYL